MKSWLIVGLVCLIIYFLYENGGVSMGMSDSEKIQLFGNLNNNPMNVKTLSKGVWKGQVSAQPDGIAIFDTLENGLRAGTVNTLSKFMRHPTENLIDFGNIYAPYGDGNNSGHYGDDLAKLLGVSASDPFPGRERLHDLVLAIVQNEEGKPARNAIAPMVAVAVDQAKSHFPV